MELIRGRNRPSGYNSSRDYNADGKERLRMMNRHFGFRKTPFGVTPDASLFYANSLYKEALATLRYGIEARRGFILVTGEAGTGKTTLLRKLMRDLAATTHCVSIFNTHLTFTDLLRLTLRDLGLATGGEDRVTMIEELNGHLVEQLNKGRIVSLLIDEAQNLGDETLEGLRLLSNLETDDERLLQIVLVGQPELEGTLDRLSRRHLRQRVALRCRLVPLKRDEVGPYIDFRLQAAGYEGENLFLPDAVKQIALYSGGIPRLINTLCDGSLLVAHARSEREVAAQIIQEVAHNLRLSEQPRAKMEGWATEAPLAEAKEQGFQVPNDEVVGDLWHAPSKELENWRAGEPIRRRKGRLASVATGTLVALMLLSGAGAAFYPQQTRDYLSRVAASIGDFIEAHGEDLNQSFRVPARNQGPG